MMAPASSGGCMGGNCGSGAAKTPIYPSLMTLPALTPEKRAEIDALASQQINEGMGRLANGSESLERATQAGDNAAMQQSVGMMREGLDELGAGIAARRVLSEGKAPRNLALDWFKREMNLASPIAREEPRALLGVTPFHLFTMVLLIAFALAMVAMYFFKMRRAAALFGRLEADSGAPPPGASPPLAGAPGPSSPAAPPAGKAPPPGGTPPPSAAPTPSSPPAPAGRKVTGAGSAGRRGAACRACHARRRNTTRHQFRRPEVIARSAVPEATSASPVTANWRGQLRVGSIVTETPSVKTFRLLPSSSDRLLPFTFVPGQFLNVAFWIGGARMNRSYSISSSPTQRDYVELTVRREPRGAVSRHIDDLLKVGDQIEAGGPVGRFTFTGTEADSIVLIAGGVGITPMMSITRYLTERSWPGDIFFIYTCRTPTDFIFANEVAALQRRQSEVARRGHDVSRRRDRLEGPSRTHHQGIAHADGSQSCFAKDPPVRAAIDDGLDQGHPHRAGSSSRPREDRSYSAQPSPPRPPPGPPPNRLPLRLARWSRFRRTTSRPKFMSIRPFSSSPRSSASESNSLAASAPAACAR